MIMFPLSNTKDITLRKLNLYNTRLIVNERVGNDKQNNYLDKYPVLMIGRTIFHDILD